MEEEQENVNAAVSEQQDVHPADNIQEEQEQSEPKMVPLTALQAERRKRQEAEAQRQEADARAQLYQGYLMRAKEEKPESEDEDPHALVEKGTLHEQTVRTKREIREEVYQDMNPKAVEKINKYLKQILDKKPWLIDSLNSAQNRWARASEIVDDYIHLVEEPKAKTSSMDAKRIVENANKPRSPVEIGKSARPSGTEYLKSIQGKKEFREYREKVLRGEA